MSTIQSFEAWRARVWRVVDRGVEVGHFDDVEELEVWLESAVMLGYLRDDEDPPANPWEARRTWETVGEVSRYYLDGAFVEFPPIRRAEPKLELDDSEIPF